MDVRTYIQIHTESYWLNETVEIFRCVPVHIVGRAHGYHLLHRLRYQEKELRKQHLVLFGQTTVHAHSNGELESRMGGQVCMCLQHNTRACYLQWDTHHTE
jgi:hypothetical protein